MIGACKGFIGSTGGSMPLYQDIFENEGKEAI